MAYVRIARWTQEDLQGTTWRLDLFEDGATLDTAEYNLTGPMFTLTYEGDMIKEGRLELEWLLENSTQYAKAASFTEGSLTTYLIELYKNGSIYWRGFLDPRLIELTEGDYPRRTKLTFRDLVNLDAFYPKIGSRLTTSYKTLVDIIAECLPFTNDIKTYTTWTHTALGSGDWLNQVYVDEFVFREPRDTGLASQDGEITYREVLNNVLFAADLTCIQSDGDWHLMQRDYLDNSTYTRYNYDSDGDADSTTPVSSSVDLDQSIDSTNSWMLPTSTAFWQGEIKQNSFQYDHRLQLTNIQFPTDGYRIDDGDADVVLSQPFTAEVATRIRFFTAVTAQINEVIDRIDASATINVEMRIGDTGNYRYWNGTSWVTTQTNILNQRASGVGFIGDDFALSTQLLGAVDIVTGFVPLGVDGNLQITLQPATKSGQTIVFTLYQNNELEFLGDTDEDNSQSIAYSLTTDRASKQIVSYGEYIIGQGPTSNARGAFKYDDSGDKILLDSRFKRAGGVETSLANCILRSRMDFFRRTRKTIRAEVYGEYEAHKILSYDSMRMVFDRGVFVGREGRWRTAYFIEINPETASSLSATDTFDTSVNGVLPAANTPTDFSGRTGIEGFGDQIDSLDENFGSDGTSAPSVREDGTPLQTGDLVYNTFNGDTVPYRFQRVKKYYDFSDFTTTTDGFTATGGTVTALTSSVNVGVSYEPRGFLEFISNTTGTGNNLVSLASPPYDGYFRVEVYIPSSNTTLLGIKAYAPGLIGSTTTTDSWVTLEGGVNNASTFTVAGTDSGGNISFSRTNGDIFLVRNVEYYGNVVNQDSSGNISTNYDQKSFSYRVDNDILLVQDVTDDSIESWGYIVAVSATPGFITEVTEQTSKAAKYIIYGILRRALTSIRGDYIQTGTLDASVVNVTNLNADNITTWTATVDGTLTIGSGGSIVGSNYTFDDTGGTIAGWTIDSAALQSASSGARIELRQDDKRVVVHDGTNEIVAMGFLEGLAKNDGSGNWGAGVYGFWAKDSDSLQIDGDVSYEDGDWIIENNGAYKVVDSSDNEVIRLGYYDPGAGTDYGLWFFRDNGNLLGYVKGDEIKIGVSGQSMTYTPAGGLVVEGTVTATSLVTDNLSTSAGVEIDEDGATFLEPVTIGGLNTTSGSLTFKDASAGDEVLRIWLLPVGATDIATLQSNGHAMWLYAAGDSTANDYQADIQLLAEGFPTITTPYILMRPQVRIENGGQPNSVVLQVDGDMEWDNITVATSATAGTNGDVPAQVVGYITINVNGTNRKIPYYAT